jgi:hypothetical protein
VSTIVYSRSLTDKEFRQYMEDNRYKPLSFCPICKTQNSRIGAHLFLKHDWSREQAREFYRSRIVFVHSMAAQGDKLVATARVRGEMDDYDSGRR